MRVVVDGIDDIIAVENDGEETLEDFFNKFKSFASENQKIVVSLTIDGYEITPPFVDDVFKKTIQSVKEIKIETVPVSELSSQTLGEIEIVLNAAIEEFKQASDIIYSQKYAESAELINRAVQKWRQCQQALSMIVDLLIAEKKEVNLENLKKEYQNMNEVIRQLSESLGNNDFMMVKDVIDYELLDRLDAVLKHSQRLKDFFA